MDNLLLQGSYYDSILKISNFGYSKSAVLDSVAVTLGLGGGGQGQVPPIFFSCLSQMCWSTWAGWLCAFAGRC